MQNIGQSHKPSVRFSVLVPVYNVEKYLEECIQSVLNQSFCDYELILVDDGSKDSSGIICDSYSEKYPQIKAYHKPNGGQLHTRKYAVDHAEGEFCVFLDSDDYLESNALERINGVITENGCDCVVYGMARVNNGKVLSLMQDKEERIITDKRELYRKCILSVEYNSMCRKAMKTAFLKDRDYPEYYYHTRHGEDLLQSLDIFRECTSVVFIKDILYNYRVNSSSVTQTIRYDNFTTDNTVREIVLDFLRQESVFNESDFMDYRSFCIRLIMIKVNTIARFNIGLDKKIQLFDELKSSDYYKGFVDNGAYDRKGIGRDYLLYELFKRKNYRILVFFISTRQTLGKWKGKIG